MDSQRSPPARQRLFGRTPTVETEAVGPGPGRTAGHRGLPHTADIRVEAWAPTREECIAEAVLGVVECFVDTSGASSGEDQVCRVRASSDEDLLVGVLDELVYLVDTTGSVPVGALVEPVEGGADVRFRLVPTDEVTQTGAVPKAVSLHELHMGPGPEGWSCAVTLDV